MFNAPQRLRGITVTVLPVDAAGLVNPSDLERENIGCLPTGADPARSRATASLTVSRPRSWPYSERSAAAVGRLGV